MEIRNEDISQSIKGVASECAGGKSAVLHLVCGPSPLSHDHPWALLGFPLYSSSFEILGRYALKWVFVNR